MKFYLEQNPIPKARHRFNSHFKRAFDPQSKEKKVCKWLFAAQMLEKGYRKLCIERLAINMTFHTPFPRSFNTSKKNSLLGHPALGKPDLDNAVKFYCDVLNGIAYGDDSQITQLWAEKLYAEKGLVEITLNPLSETLQKECVISIKGIITMSDVENLVKKAQNMAFAGQPIKRVYASPDENGLHIYFEYQYSKNNSFPSVARC